MPLPVGRSARVDLVATVACFALGLAAGAWLGVPLLALGAAAIPILARRHRAARAAEGASASLVPFLVAVVSAVRSGLALPAAIESSLYAARGELARRLELALGEMRLGAAPELALGAARPGAPQAIDAVFADLHVAAAAHLSSDAAAAFLGDVLEARRFERDLRADVVARTAGQRFQVWLLAAVVPFLALYLSAMSPTLGAELASPLGRYVLIPLGVAFELAGIAMSRHVLARACG